MTTEHDSLTPEQRRANAIAVAIADGNCIAEPTHDLVSALLAYEKATRDVDPWGGEADLGLPNLEQMATAYARGADPMKSGTHQSQDELRTEFTASVMHLIAQAVGGTAPDSEHRATSGDYAMEQLADPASPDARLHAALVDAGRAIEDLPHDERRERVLMHLAESTGWRTEAGPGPTAFDFLVGVFVSAHSQRYAVQLALAAALLDAPDRGHGSALVEAGLVADETAASAALRLLAERLGQAAEQGLGEN